MSQRKYNTEEPLNHLIGVRVSEAFYNKLEGLRKNSNCQTLGEFARMILQKEEIIWYHKDASSDTVTVELTAIRKELKAIGTNVNQVTRYFNGSTIPNQKIFDALKILDEYKRVTSQVDKLLTLLDNMLK
ncbi:MAG: plasmid mobilization relaxosome protein MobC [Cyclobacteriaceae bacterium]|nr:plasmid mobilization relaxosome protein MobC [Cyclobacteriaceae bacterium]